MKGVVGMTSKSKILILLLLGLLLVSGCTQTTVQEPQQIIKYQCANGQLFVDSQEDCESLVETKTIENEIYVCEDGRQEDTPEKCIPEPPKENFELLNTNQFYNVFGWYCINGEVKNVSNWTYEYVDVTLKVYDASGNFLERSTGYTNPSTLKANQKGTFEECITRDDAISKIKDHKIEIVDVPIEPIEEIEEVVPEPVLTVQDCGSDFDCFKLAIKDCSLAKITEEHQYGWWTNNAIIQEDCSIKIFSEGSSLGNDTSQVCELDLKLINYFDTFSELIKICNNKIQFIESKFSEKDGGKVLGGNSVIVTHSGISIQLIKIIKFSSKTKSVKSDMDLKFWKMEPKEGWKLEYFYVIAENTSLKKANFSSVDLIYLKAFSGEDEIEFDIERMRGEENISSIPVGEAAIYYGAALLPEDRTVTKIFYNSTIGSAEVVFLFE